MEKRLFFWITLIPATFLLCLPVTAATASVVINANEVRYYDAANQIEASGAVTIKYKNIQVECERAVIDQDLKTALATGGVKVTKGEDTYWGEYFLYDLKSQRGWLKPMNTEITDSEIKGPTFLKSDEAFYHDEDASLKKAYFTSCDWEHPHYHLTAAEVEYYPDERIIFRKVWYWERNVRLFFLPYLAISLREDDNNFDPPKVGRDETVGWFLYLTYNYYVNDNSYGKIKLDTTEKGGDGVGVQHYIKNSATSRWYQEYYFLNNSDNSTALNEYMFKYGYENWTNPRKKWDTALENWYNCDAAGTTYLETTYNYNFYGVSPYPRLYFEYETDEDLERQLDFSGNWSYAPGRGWEINTNGRWLYTHYFETLYPINQFDYYLNTKKSWSNSSYAQFRIKNRQVLSGDYSSTNLLPELSYVYSNWKWPLVGAVNFNTQYTRMEKISRDDDEITSKENGVRLGIDLRKTVKLWDKKRLTLSTESTMRYRDFIINDEKSQLTAFTETLGLTGKFSDKLSTTVSVGFTEKEGEPNTFFNSDDYILAGAFLTNAWYWRSKIFSASLSSGYNFYSEYVYPVNFRAGWNFGNDRRIDFSTVYYNDDGLGQTDLDINYSPKENWRLGLFLGFDFESDYWTQRQFQAEIIEELTDKWRMELVSRYDPFQNEFATAQVRLVYDWHCREVVFYYDEVENEYWIQLNFKAFPQAQLRLSADPTEYFY